MKYREAHSIATEILDLLRPHCVRCEIAGSIRRRKADVKDIEIVAIPKPYETGLFESGIATVVNQWQKVKGELQYGKCKYTQRTLPQGIKLDLFFAQEDNWGLIFAIRTGSAEYSHHVLARTWVRQGYNSVNGFLMKNGKTVPIREEQDLFSLLRIRYVEPHNRIERYLPTYATP